MNRTGFTLIELLIVVVIIGLLAAIAIPKFANTKEKAYIASMKSDLRYLSSGRRHTISLRDWSSDVCSSDPTPGSATYCETTGNTLNGLVTTSDGWKSNITNANTTRSEERRVGKECRSRGSPEDEKKSQKAKPQVVTSKP